MNGLPWYDRVFILASVLIGLLIVQFATKVLKAHADREAYTARITAQLDHALTTVDSLTQQQSRCIAWR